MKFTTGLDLELSGDTRGGSEWIKKHTRLGLGCRRLGRKEGQCSASVSGLNKRVKIGVLLLYSEGANGSGVSLLKKKTKNF